MPHTTDVPSPRFPMEMFEMFIEHLHSDVPSLSSCSLVCRSWVHPSQSHLFSSLCVHAQADSFAFFVTLITNMPHIAQHIRRLHLTGAPRFAGIGQSTRGSGIVQVDAHQIHDISCRLQHLHTLKLEEVHVIGPLVSRVPTLAVRLAKLEMIMAGSNLNSAQDILSILTVFLEIGTLHLDSIGFNVDSWAKGTSASQLSRHREMLSNIKVSSLVLQLAPRYSHCMCEAIRKLLPLHHLRSINVCCESWKDVAGLGALLHDAGVSIKYVQFGTANVIADLFYYPINRLSLDSADKWRILELQSCSSLRSITFPLELDDSIEYSYIKPVEWTAFVHILSYVSRNIHRVAFKMQVTLRGVDSLDNTGLFDWGAMDKALDQFAQLRAVTFEVESPESSEEVWRSEYEKCCMIVRSMLPRQHARGLLRFSVSSVGDGEL